MIYLQPSYLYNNWILPVMNKEGFWPKPWFDSKKFEEDAASGKFEKQKKKTKKDPLIGWISHIG